MIAVVILLAILCITLLFATFNLLRKVEFYEQNIQEFYSALSIVLHNMRLIDTRQMFENDDEVGVIFQQLKDILYTLRPILYDEEADEKTEKN